MAFNATFIFTGACGIVPKQQPPLAFCILLPNLWDDNPHPGQAQRTSAVDGVPLRRHLAYMYHTTERVPPTVPLNKGAAGIWYFDGHRLKITPDFGQTPPQPASWGADLRGLATFQDISTIGQTDRFLGVANAVQSPRRSVVTGQVFFEHGVLTCPEEAKVWVFDPYLLRPQALPFRPNTRRLNHEVRIQLQGLDSLTITATPLYTMDPPRPFVFTGPDIEITIANLCEHNPLRWGNQIAGDSLVDDDDFRVHYELVDDPSRLGLELGSFFCPIPRVARGTGAGGGFNCFPLQFPAVNFTP